jgi:hypothetical protein
MFRQFEYRSQDLQLSVARLGRCLRWWFQAGLPAWRAHRAEGNEAGSRRKPQPLHIKPVTIGDLIRDGKLLEVHCGNCRPARHLYIDADSLDLPKRLPVPEVANHLVCSVCGAKNSDTYHPIWARPDARSSGATGQYPDYSKG